ncbi:MAG: hypothetical protein R3F19_22800 [Verrucomicrobiales bacterium]
MATFKPANASATADAPGEAVLPMQPNACPAVVSSSSAEFQGRAVAVGGVGRACLQKHLVQFRVSFALGVGTERLGEPWKVPVRAAADCLVEHHAQGENVRRRLAGAFSRHVALGPHERGLRPAPRDQTCVRQSRFPDDEDNVRGLHVAVHQTRRVQVRESARQLFPQSRNLQSRHLSTALCQEDVKRQRRVGPVVPAGVVRQLHHVVEAAAFLVDADLEDVDQRFVPARNRLETAHALELPQVGPLVGEAFAADNLDRAPGAQCVFRQPDLPVSTPPDEVQQNVIVNGGSAHYGSGGTVQLSVRMYSDGG